MNEKIETVIIGGGQAGLSASYYLQQQARENVVLEQAAQPANAWRNDRWDSFTLLTPNWSFRLPGAEYAGDNPDGFMPKDEIVTRFEEYVKSAQLPVRFGVHVNSVERDADSGDYLVKTDANTIHARNVIIATGLFQHAKIPAFSKALSPKILQLASRAIPQSAVAAAGSGAGGGQRAIRRTDRGGAVPERPPGVPVPGHRRARSAPLPRQGCVRVDAPDRLARTAPWTSSPHPKPNLPPIRSSAARMADARSTFTFSRATA